MPIDLSATLRQAIVKLQADKIRIERQIVALEQALNAGVGIADDASMGNAGATSRRAKRMSSAARKAISARMKAYWAKRKTPRTKKKKKVA
jgi:hypothetical protein